MAVKKYSPAEAYCLSDDESVVLVKTKSGGWITYIAADNVTINGRNLIDDPVIASRMLDIKIGIAEVKGGR